MTERPKKLLGTASAVAAALAGVPLAALEKMQQDLREFSVVRGYTTASARQKSQHRVAHDKRAARKKRNRKINRRFQHG